MRALQKGGVDVKEPRQLYRALYSNVRFHNVGRGQWGFATWYPTSVRVKGNKEQPPADEQAEPIDSAQAERDLPPETSGGPLAREDTKL